MAKQTLVKVVRSTSSTQRVVTMTGMMLLASAAIGVILTLFVAR